jgi:hypothetical protein
MPDHLRHVATSNRPPVAEFRIHRWANRVRLMPTRPSALDIRWAMLSAWISTVPVTLHSM